MRCAIIVIAILAVPSCMVNGWCPGIDCLRGDVLLGSFVFTMRPMMAMPFASLVKLAILRKHEQANLNIIKIISQPFNGTFVN